MSQFTHLFALSVYRDSLELDPTRRRELSQLVLDRSNQNRDATEREPAEISEEAWLGDTAGQEFLFSDPAFEPVFRKIGDAVRSYLEGLGIDSSKLRLYFQRAWATVSHEGQRIFEHAHVQSHISFAYYLKKPVDGGGIYFSVAEHPNELAPGLFTLAKASAGLLKTPSERNLNRMYIEPKEDEILIFPSKTLHSTAPNMTDEPRVSISADIVLTLADSSGHETLMPAVENWRAF